MNMEVARVLPQSKLGVFDDACRDFVEQVINLVWSARGWRKAIFGPCGYMDNNSKL
jgi:hypothetical protein